MFRDRVDAGLKLAEKLKTYENSRETIVLGIPRGGVEVAFVLASRLTLPLDVLIIRKVRHPFNEELALGAASTDTYFLHEDISRYAKGIPIQERIREAQAEARQRAAGYRTRKPALSLKGLNVILVDDGIATGSTTRLAIELVRKQGPKRIILAIPVAPEEVIRFLHGKVDHVVCLHAPASFDAVGEWYENFSPVGDEKVMEYLMRNRHEFMKEESINRFETISPDLPRNENHSTENIYSEKQLEEQMDEDEIQPREAGFMEGYLNPHTTGKAIKRERKK